MSAPRGLVLRRAGPGLTLQDAGRPGYQTQGLSRGGAMDPVSLAEAQALVGGAPDAAALEIPAAGIEVEVFGAAVIVGLAGAVMRAEADGRRLAWHASHRLDPGTRLSLRGAGRGSYAYLALSGGIAGVPVMGSLSRHEAVGLGPALAQGDPITVAGPDAAPPGQRIATRLEIPDDAPVRILPGVHADLFPEEVRRRFAGTVFHTSARANRMGAALDHAGGEFATRGHLSVTSEVVTPGDIQMVGGGQPYVLFNECQTTGGYPRIATVIAADLPRLAQMPPGAQLRFAFVEIEDALVARRMMAQAILDAPRRLGRLLRDPADIGDLLSYQLVDGVTAGREEDG